MKIPKPKMQRVVRFDPFPDECAVDEVLDLVVQAMISGASENLDSARTSAMLMLES